MNGFFQKNRAIHAPFMEEMADCGRIVNRIIKVASVFCLTAHLHAQPRLDVSLDALFGDRPLAFDTLAFETGEGRRISITRCDLLLSKAALRRADGEWIGAGSWAAYVSLRDGRSSFSLNGIPEGKYTALRFNIGVPPETNAGDPAKFPAGHPLNPAVNGMHWGWQGGYIFAAIEGRWRDGDGTLSGFSYHIANDGNMASVELPVELDMSQGRLLRVAFHADRIFEGLAISKENSSTHSRDSDSTAGLIRENLRHAFEMKNVTATPDFAEAVARSKALIAPEATLYRFTFPSDFPRPSLPEDNPLTEEGVELGRRLFHDRGLSGNGSQSCATCHERRDAFSDRRKFSIGAFGDVGKRQSMPLFNLAWKSAFFWDGRTPTLRAQTLEPMKNPVEMHSDLAEVRKRVVEGRHYPDMFATAFGTGEVDEDRISRALEQYLLTLVSDDSKFDRAARGQARLSEEERRGEVLFTTEYDPARGLRGADCFHCHGGPLFRSADFANNGLDSMPTDAGRFIATGRDGDSGKFAVPSLRNVALTAPYMHDGRFATLEEVIAHYDHGVSKSATLDPNLAKHPA